SFQIIRKKRNDLRNVDMNIYENQTIFGQGDDKVDSFLDHLILLSQRHNGFTDTELREEMTTFLLAVRVLDDDGEKLFKDMLSDLKYLDMVLKESLRLFPPTPLIIRKTTNEITLPSGYTVPAETGIIISIWGAHRDPNYWGPDADWFKPERFEAGGKTGLYIPFSTGPRNCVGYRYASLTAKSALVSILRQFKVVTEEEDGPIPTIDCKFAIMLKPKHDVVSDIENISRETFKTAGIQKMWGGTTFFIALTNPADIEHVSKNCLEKDLLVMKGIRAFTGDGGIFAPVSIWSRRRKVIIPAFSPKILNSFLDIFTRRSADLVEKLKELSGTGTFDIWPIVNTYTLTSIAGQDDKVDSFLDHLILLSQRQNGFTDTELREEINTFLLAATDTSAVAICNTLLLLGKYPKIQEKVHEELVRVFENDNEKSFKDILTSSGYTIPANTSIIILIWGAHRDPNYWGPDADCFKPERFESGGKTGLFMPFSTVYSI
ncbi:unnamed protein product, partial [Leptidea sinapis]